MGDRAGRDRPENAAKVAAWRREGRHCERCGELRRVPDEIGDDPRSHRGVCVECQKQAIRERQREWLRAKRASDAEFARVERERHQRYIAENQEKIRDYERRRREQYRADPERRAIKNENARLAYHLRRERAGRPAAPKANKRTSGYGERLNADLLHRAALEFVKNDLPDWMTEDEAAEILGISSRTLREWGAGTRHEVRADVADRVLIGMGKLWWEVWEKPANGHKDGRPADVLRYIDDVWIWRDASLAFTGELPE